MKPPASIWNTYFKNGWPKLLLASVSDTWDCGINCQDRVYLRRHAHASGIPCEICLSLNYFISSKSVRSFQVSYFSGPYDFFMYLKNKAKKKCPVKILRICLSRVCRLPGRASAMRSKCQSVAICFLDVIKQKMMYNVFDGPERIIHTPTPMWLRPLRFAMLPFSFQRRDLIAGM